VRLGKRILGSRALRTVVATAIRPFRATMLAGSLLDGDVRFAGYMATGRPAVFLCWHQDFVSTLGYLSRWSRTRRMVALASPSRDGGLAAAAALGLGFRDIARGSSREGGAAGLLRLSRLSRGDAPTSVVVVADGPRPPARVLKAGGLLVARDAGLPVWLLRTSWWPSAELRRSWARFHVPRPWANAVFRADGPIAVDPALDRAGLEALRVEVEARMIALAGRADADARAVWGA